MKIWRGRRSEWFTCAMAWSWTIIGRSRNDRALGIQKSHIEAAAVGVLALRLQSRRRGDDRSAVDWRGAALAVARRKVGWRRRSHGSARGNRRRSHEDGRAGWTVLLDRSCAIHLRPTPCRA